jgi:phage terminase large subunit-like protein
LDRVAFAEELGISPDPWQKDLLRSGSDRVLLNITRQGGKSTMSALIALHQALYRPGSLVLCLAPAERQSKELFSKIVGLYRQLHDAPPPESDRKLGMHLVNGSRIEALPGTERTVRSFSGVDLLILDEAARIDDALYYAVKPMLAVSGGRLLMLSTPYGRRGVFHQEWTEGIGWERYEVPASECPRIPAEFLEAERQSMPQWWFSQEYGCQFSETEDQVFSHAMITNARDDELQEHRFEGEDQLWT